MAERNGKKQHVRDSFRDFAEERLEIEIGKATHVQRTKALAEFYVLRIHNHVSTPVLSADDIRQAWVDGAHDLGVDLIARDDGKVLILQAKHFTKGGAASYDEVVNFQSVLERLRDRKFKANRWLSDIRNEVDFSSDHFEMRFVCLGSLVGQALEQSRSPILINDPDLAGRVDIAFLDEAALTDQLRNALSMASGTPGVVTLHASGTRKERSSVVTLEGGTKTCVIVVDAAQLIDLYKSAREKLFTLNIRTYLGSNRINRAIRKTLKEQPENFYYFNNGIACIAKSLTIHTDRIDADGLQVINGAQTLRALVESQKVLGKVPNARVLVRVTESPAQYGAEGRFAQDIVRFNNTQNPIKTSDFRSNDAIHQSIQEQFAAFRHQGSEIAYQAKRGEKVHRGAVVVPMEEFAKVIFSFLVNPIAFSGSTSFLFSEGAEGGYWKVFGDGDSPWTTMPPEEFRLRSAIWWMAEEFGKAIKLDRETMPDAKIPLERRWFLLFVSRLILERNYGTDYRVQLGRRFKGDWNLPDDDEMAQLYERSRDSLIYVFKSSAERGGESFSQRGWMRSPNTVRELEIYARSGPGLDFRKRR